ncbi:MAG: hypothetical protein ACNA77_02320 [Opitutales bacterium]
MKLKTTIIATACAVASFGSAVAQEVINFTGATAFRAAANTVILQSLDNVEHSWTGNQSLGGANRAIFKGSLNGTPVIIRTSWSGSAGGVRDVLQENPVQLLLTSVPTYVGGQQLDPADIAFETEVATFAFSDVAQDATLTPSPALVGTPVGVVPFVMLANKGAPAGITNMTDQMFDLIYSVGNAPLSIFTGDEADEATFVISTGRASTSGTRITMLAETGFGINKTVNQFEILREDQNDFSLVEFGDVQPFPTDDVNTNGYSSNSFIRHALQRESNGFHIVGYLTLSDAIAAQAGGAKWLTYNGVPYTEENVLNGTYTLWGYQQFYHRAGLTATEQTLKDTLIAGMPAALLSSGAGIPETEMKVVRTGGDGGPIFPR